MSSLNFVFYQIRKLFPEPPVGHFYTSAGREISKETTEAALWRFFTEFYDFSGLDLPDEDRNMTLGDYYFRQIDSDQDIAGDKDLHDSLSGMSLGLAALSSEDLARVGLLGMTRAEVIPGGDAILPDGMRSVIKALERKIEEGGGQIELGETVSKIDWSGEKEGSPAEIFSET